MMGFDAAGVSRKISVKLVIFAVKIAPRIGRPHVCRGPEALYNPGCYGFALF